jgi:hypothetical protein
MTRERAIRIGRSLGRLSFGPFGYAMEEVMRPAQKGKAKLIAAFLREAAMIPMAFDAAIVIALVAYVLLLMAFVQSPLFAG